MRLVGPRHSGISVPLSAEEMLQMPVQRPEGGTPTTELPFGSLVTHPRELNILSSSTERQQDGKLDNELWQENGLLKMEDAAATRCQK